MVRNKTIALVLTGLLATPAWAGTPLPPGKPAGTARAQLDSNQTTFVGVGILVLGAGLYLASGKYKLAGSGGGGAPNLPPPPTTTTTTTTTH